MNDLKDLLATLRHVVWNRGNITIDGSHFSLAELQNIVESIDQLLEETNK